MLAYQASRIVVRTAVDNWIKSTFGALQTEPVTNRDKDLGKSTENSTNGKSTRIKTVGKRRHHQQPEKCTKYDIQKAHVSLHIHPSSMATICTEAPISY